MNSQGLLDIVNQRASEQQQIWVVGCSFAYGSNLEDLNKRYGQLISTILNRPVTFLVWPGSSISWAADQVLRSDIKKGDIVIWGITSVERFMLYYKNKIFNVLNLSIEDDSFNHSDNDYPKELLRRKLVDEDRIMYAIKNIFQVDNFCKLIGAHLILFPHHDLSSDESEKTLLSYIGSLENCVLPSKLVDYGNDQQHPGPLTHKNWAGELLTFIKEKGL
jgi:hypothetical protein